MEDSDQERAIAVQRVQLSQLRRDRWQNIAGQVGASPVLVALAWDSASHANLIAFAVTHHIAVWIMAIMFILPLRDRSLTRIPTATILAIILAQATLSLALLFDPASASSPVFMLSVCVVLYACAAGSLATLGSHKLLLRIALTSLLFPFCISAIMFDHYVVAAGTAFFYLIVVVIAVSQVSRGQEELIGLRLDAAARATEAEDIAETDALTGLRNRYGLLKLENSELQHSATLLFLDLNRFKPINDQHGHAAGDQVLKIVASRLLSCVKTSDVVARFGGDEFLILAHDLGLQEEELLAKRLKEIISQPMNIDEVGELFVSVSIGRSRSEAKNLDLAALIAHSDQEMYEEKENSRNQEGSASRAA